MTRARIDEVVERWKSECLLKDGSLLFDDKKIWTAAHLQEFRDRFLGNLIHGTKSDFEDKLEIQLKDASPEVCWLVCELLAVYFLFAFIAIGGDKKLEIMQNVIDPLDADPPPHWELVESAMYEGIGNPGSGYNIRRDLQVSYLFDFTSRWKALPAEEQRAKLDDPWALRDFADDASEDVAVREMRHILLHLLRPDEFERISSGTHKRQIVDAFRGEFLDGEPRCTWRISTSSSWHPEQLEELKAQPAARRRRWSTSTTRRLRGIWDRGPPTAARGRATSSLLLYKKHSSSTARPARARPTAPGLSPRR